jgi:S-DNA-T family DNA segregation ATPase FtsK/SpoIIIE
MRQKLEFQADRIEAVLALHKVPAHVTGGTVTPRWVRFQILPALGARISRIRSLSEELATALDSPNCRVSRNGAAVTVEVPRDDPQPVRLLPLYHQLTNPQSAIPSPQSAIHNPQSTIPPLTAILGLAEDGAPLLIRLPSPDVAHILVAGTTGSGKTVLLQAMILSLALANPAPLLFHEQDRGEGSAPSPSQGEGWSEGFAPSPSQGEGWGEGLALVLIDPKGHAFSLFEGLPHLARPVIQDVAEATEALHSLIRLMERRSPCEGGLPHIVVVIDELADLIMTGGQPVQWALTRLTQRGREAGIHVVAATQKPTAAVLGALVKANFPVRLVGHVTCIEDARTATGWSGTGAERLMGRGDFLAVAEGRVIRFQAAHVSAEEVREAVARLARGGSYRDSPASWPSLPWPVRRLAEVIEGGG